LEEEEMFNKIEEVEHAHKDQRHTMGWKLIIELSDRKSTHATLIQGDSAELEHGSTISETS
jgi:hypothetical protein